MTLTPLESIRSDLLDESKLFTIVFVDNAGREHERSIKLKNPYELDLGAFLPNSEIMSLEKFFQLTADVIEDAQARQGIDGDKRTKLIEEFPGEEYWKNAGAGHKVITWKVRERQPARMDAKGRGRPQWGNTWVRDLMTRDYPANTIVIDGRPIDHTIEFTCWSESATLANELALWLERTLCQNDWAFKAKGVDRFIWTGRGPDTFWTSSGQRLHQRPLTWMVRLFEYEARALTQIKSFNLELNLEEEQ